MRIANREDLPRIVEIYNSTVADRKATADTDTVTVDERQSWFEEHEPAHRPLLVEKYEGQVIGWLSFEDFYGRPAYAATAEISIYLDKSYRSSGVGSRMLREAIDMAPCLGIKNLVAFVFSHNVESIVCVRSSAFRCGVSYRMSHVWTVASIRCPF